MRWFAKKQAEAVAPIEGLRGTGDRWSTPGAKSGLEFLTTSPPPHDLKAIEIFSEFNDKLLAKWSPDVSIAAWRRGSILFEEGSYIDLAFFVLDGQVELHFSKQAPAAGAPIFEEGRTVVFAPMAQPEGSTVFMQQLAKQRPTTAEGVTFLATLDFGLTSGTKTVLGPGEVLGEIGALSGWPQSVTARTATDCRLVQIRLPVLREMRQRSQGLKARLDTMYRERALEAQLRATPLFRGSRDELIRELCQSVELISCDPDQEIAREGESADGIYLVRSGFVKLSQRLGERPLVLTYLSKGMTFGETEQLLDGVDRWTATASSMQYSELVKIGGASLRKIFAENPAIKTALWKSGLDRIRELGMNRRRLNDAAFVDTALETGLVQGNSVLVIDLNRCTRCDDCVKGCASTHGGTPRFVREGEKVQNLLIAKACFHCRDPLCLVGCPTGAIRRANVGATVEIDPALCIGCASCANNCPYDTIVMEDTGTLWPADALPERLRDQPRLLAQKCDLCHTRPDGPACVKNCPNHCATRVGSVEEFRALLGRE